MLIKPKSLIERINTALAWGMPDNESTGYTVPELLKLLAECRDELTGMRPPEADPVPQHTHDEIAMPEGYKDVYTQPSPPQSVITSAMLVNNWFHQNNVKNGKICGLVFGADSHSEEATRLEALVASTQKLLSVRSGELEDSLRVRNQLRAENQMLLGKVSRLEISGFGKTEAKRRIEKIEKHLNALKETING